MIRRYTTAELAEGSDIMSQLDRFHMSCQIAVQRSMDSWALGATDTHVYWLVKTPGTGLTAIACGYVDLDDQVLDMQVFCWVDGTESAILEDLYKTLFRYAQSLGLSTLRVKNVDDDGELAEFLQAMGMGMKHVYDHVTFTAFVPTKRAAIKPHEKVVHLPTVFANTGKVVYFPTAKITADNIVVLLGSKMNSVGKYAVNLLGSRFPMIAYPPGSDVYILMPFETSDLNIDDAMGFAFVKRGAVGVCTVVELHAGDVNDVNTLLRTIGSTGCAQIDMLTPSLSIDVVFLLPGAEGQWKHGEGITRWVPGAIPASRKRGVDTAFSAAAARPRRVTISQQADVFDTHPKSLATALAKRADDDPSFLKGMETSWRPGPARKYDLISSAGAARKKPCHTVVFLSQNEMETHPELGRALHNSQLCQGNTYLALAADGLLGVSAAAARLHAKPDITFWFLMSSDGDVCAAAVTRVSNPLAKARYKQGIEHHAVKFGKPVAEKTFQIEYFCWHVGVPDGSLHELLSTMERHAKSRACVRIWTYLKPDEIAETRFLQREGFAMTSAGVFEKAL
jgi:hypothetical protein